MWIDVARFPVLYSPYLRNTASIAVFYLKNHVWKHKKILFGGAPGIAPRKLADAQGGNPPYGYCDRYRSWTRAISRRVRLCFFIPDEKLYSSLILYFNPF